MRKIISQATRVAAPELRDSATFRIIFPLTNAPFRQCSPFLAIQLLYFDTRPGFTAVYALEVSPNGEKFLDAACRTAAALASRSPMHRSPVSFPFRRCFYHGSFPSRGARLSLPWGLIMFHFCIFFY
jgi:hypothetical protein